MNEVRASGMSGWELEPEDRLWPETVHPQTASVYKLHGIGDPTLLSKPCLSIIGSRRPTPNGVAVARHAAEVAASWGLVVVTGGAIGCDGEATRAALKAGGEVVIIPGSGADVVYPKRNRDLFEAAWNGEGAVVSLEEWGKEPRRHAFPRRNRLIAALSKALVVCEAAMPSGTFTTAEAADEMDRRIFAAPGSIFSPEAQGTNWLIANGAAIIADLHSLEVDIGLTYGHMELFSPPTARPSKGKKPLFAVPAEEEELVKALLSMPLTLQALAVHLGREQRDLMQVVTQLEMRGWISRRPDGRYQVTTDVLNGNSALSRIYGAQAE